MSAPRKCPELGIRFCWMVLAGCMLLAPPGTARAADPAMQGDCGGMQGDCPCMQDPLGTLDDCIAHHYEAGEILSAGVYQSLLALAGAAQDAASRGEVGAAINILQAFIDEVDALSGTLIVGQAVHLAMHAQMAIVQLGG